MHADVPYRTYWIAWLILLGLTLTMIFISHPAVLIAGMSIKATIIGLWFMHLKYERPGFTAIIALAIFGTALLLFGLIVPDGMAM